MQPRLLVSAALAAALAAPALVLPAGAEPSAPPSAAAPRGPAAGMVPASSAPALSGKPTDAEAPFVSAAAAALMQKYPTAADAVRAGYERYTNEDTTGAISYADRMWASSSASRPSQLWYDVHGKLLGADYSEPYAAGKPPAMFGLAPSRWGMLPQHVHYGLVGPGGTTVYGGTATAKLVAAGDAAAKPTAAGLVKAGIAKKASDVRFVFDFPAIWDVAVWLVPNPDGAFAESDPLVKPVADGKP